MTIWHPVLEESGPVYLAITRAIESDILAERIRPGDRLPAHRDLAAALGVNVGTVTRAYAEARRRGLVRGEVGRGTFVSRRQPPPLSSAPGQRGAGPIDLSINLPLVDPAPDLAAALHQLADAPDLDARMGYGDPAGSLRARRAGVRWLEQQGIESHEDQVVVCAGAQHAILVALASLAGPGDTVLAEALTYPGFLGAARMLGLRVRAVEIDAGGLVPESLEAICRTERPRLLYCMPALQNPTAARLTAGRRRRIAEIATSYDLTIVQDDVQGALLEDPYPSLATLSPARVLTIASLSKTLVPGLRLAFLSGAGLDLPRTSEVIWSSVWMASQLSAEIASQWIEDGTGARVLSARRDEMKARHTIAARILGQFSYTTQVGAYHLWLDVPEPWAVAPFVAELDRLGVRVSPADSFMIQPGAAPRAVRVSLSSPTDRQQLERGLDVIADLLSGRHTASPPRL